MRPEQSARGQIRSVQALRAIAALFVVGFHSTVLWHDRFEAGSTPWENGNAGVDLFFVISGFIMVLSSRRLLALADGWRRFVLLRLVRIVPLYWLMTSAKLAALAAVPAIALHTHPTAWNIIASYCFVPSRDAAGVVRPVLDVGWTLSFEMLFYAVFAAAMFLRRAPVAVVAPVMIVLALASLEAGPRAPAIASLADPIVLEFVMGLLAAGLFMAGRLEARAACPAVLLAAAGLACLALMPADGRWQRAAFWGLAATAALCGAAALERRLGHHVPGFLVRIGEASYSLYLTHGFVLPVIGVAMARPALQAFRFEAVLVPVCLVASTAAALVIYRLAEVPMTTWLRCLAGDHGRTPLGRPEAAI